MKTNKFSGVVALETASEAELGDDNWGGDTAVASKVTGNANFDARFISMVKILGNKSQETENKIDHDK